MKNPYEVIKIDKYTGKIQSPTLLLMNRSFNIIGKISRYDNWNISLVANGIDEISFDVHKYVDGKLCPVWDDLIDLKIVEVSNFGRFEINVDYKDNSETVKSVHGQSLEVELSQIGLHEFHVNDEDATDMQITEYNRQDFDAHGNFIPTVFYNPNDPEHSLLHRVLDDKVPHWSLGYITPYIVLDEGSTPESSSSFQRTYTVDGDSIYDFLTGTVAEESNIVFVFDTINRTINCYNLCEYTIQNTTEYIGSVTLTSVGLSEPIDCGHIFEITNISNSNGSVICYLYDSNNNLIGNSIEVTSPMKINTKNAFYVKIRYAYFTGAVNTISYKIIYSNGIIHGDSIGEDTNIMVSKQKLANEITISSNKDNVKNCFRIEGGDDMITDMVRVANMNGSNYIYQFADFQYNDMSQELQERIKSYQEMMSSKETQEEYYGENGIYTRLCKTYDDLVYYESSMMPNTDQVTKVGDAKEQYDKVVSELKKSSVAVSSMNDWNSRYFVGVTNNIEAYAKIFLDSRFDLEIVDETVSYSYVENATSGIWTGKIRIIQHTDENNVYPAYISSVSPINVNVNSNELEFAKQKIEKALSKGSMLDIDFDITGMDENDMREYFNKYSLNRLNSFYDGYNSCISILATLGQTVTSDVKDTIYSTYYKRMKIVEEVKVTRQAQVEEINAKISELLEDQKDFQKKHDFRTKLGDDLYKEFCQYRREDTYTNSNYISDGLSTSECLAKAKELIEAAEKEAKKACILQRTVSTSLNNLFALPEFEPLYDKFALFNYIRIRTEDEILRLRLIGIDFNGESASEIQVTFSEQIESVDGSMSDLQSILTQAVSIATSYPSTVLQSKQGSKAQNAIQEMYTHGLNAAKTTLSNNDNNEVTITSSGILCKRMDDEGFYGEKQFRITGNIMAFTKDNWQSVTLAIGETSFNDPRTDEIKQAYGIVAENIVGKMIVSENMYIGNETKSVQITGDGIDITNGSICLSNDEYSIDIDPNHRINNNLSNYLFCIRNKTDNNIIMGVDTNGRGHFNGEINGGSININDKFKVDGEGNVSLPAGTKISWTDITDKNTVLTQNNYTTTITKDYISSLNVVAGSVAAENITGNEISGFSINGGTINGSTIKSERQTIEGHKCNTEIHDGVIINQGYNDSAERKLELSRGILSLSNLSQDYSCQISSEYLCFYKGSGGYFSVDPFSGFSTSLKSEFYSSVTFNGNILVKNTNGDLRPPICTHENDVNMQIGTIYIDKPDDYIVFNNNGKKYYIKVDKIE